MPAYFDRKAFPALTAAYLLLGGVYMFYWNHVEYFVFHQGFFSYPEWLAFETHPGRFQGFPLKGAALPPGAGGAIFSREQLALTQKQIYFPRAGPPWGPPRGEP